MSAALRPVELPPEAISLIREGSPKSLTAAPGPVALPEELPRPEVHAAPEKSQPEAPPAVSPASESESAASSPKAKGKVVQFKEPAPVEREALVSTSFRVPETLLEGLLRAASERKIKRQRPFTQQEIVAEALSTWLKRGGYL